MGHSGNAFLLLHISREHKQRNPEIRRSLVRKRVEKAVALLVHGVLRVLGLPTNLYTSIYYINSDLSQILLFFLRCLFLKKKKKEKSLASFSICECLMERNEKVLWENNQFRMGDIRKGIQCCCSKRFQTTNQHGWDGRFVAKRTMHVAISLWPRKFDQIQ